MIRSLLDAAARRFGARYDYDVQYMLDINRISTSAGLRLGLLPLVSQYRGPRRGHGVWAGSIFASSLDGDCGPCVQLIVDMVHEVGIDTSRLNACRAGNAINAGDVGLGFRFAQAIIADDGDAQNLREDIMEGFGEEVLVAATFAAAVGRCYPVLKRGLGHGKACSLIDYHQETGVLTA